MRIAFIVIGNSRRSNYLNGHTLRYGNGGGSGTDGSSIMVAEYLASKGHEVVFVTDKLEPQLELQYKSQGRKYVPGQEFYGVKYTNIEFEGITNLEFDILINMLWFQDYKSLPITVTKSLIYWSHMQWIYGLDEIINYVNDNNLSLGIVNISQWEKSMNRGVMDVFERKVPNTKSTIIPNPVMDEMVNEVLSSNPKRKKHKFVFHAAWARGGNVAVDAVRKLNFSDSEFHAFDYLMATHNHPDNFFHMHNGVDKKSISRYLASQLA